MIADCELVHAVGKCLPRERQLLLTKERERGWLAAGRCGAVVEQEADFDITSGGEGGRFTIGEKLKSHRRRIVGYAVEIRACGGELGQPEKGLEVGIRTELDLELALPGPGDGGVEALEDLARKSGTGYGADGVAGIVSEIPFVKIGQLASLEEHLVRENFIGIEGGVVDLSNIDQIPN